MDITSYTVQAPIRQRIALIADLHMYPQQEVIEAVKRIEPDLIAVAGDFKSDNYLPFMASMASIAPTFVGMGNHEEHFKECVCEEICKTGAVPLDNAHICLKGITVGGLSTGYDLDWLDKFSSLKDYKILICHHPEYYKKYIRRRKVDLILSGHAHGGQIRLFGQGIFSPGQGLFPKYTSGVFENQLVISRGIGNLRKVPRWFNDSEIVCVSLRPDAM